ncbi:secretogranin-1 [Pseudophryne corroboree]|uniref:secretogranin-1 n=1 Tax=Pseudophryne corroboree TaxID=495146 RepID=UPI003081BCFE
MPPTLFLLSLLVGTMEVTAAPYDKGVRPEEMVTRCIVEVLSNALAKPNAPAIDPECKEILKKNSRHNIDQTQDEQRQYEARSIKDSAGAGKHQYESSEEIRHSDSPREENEKRHKVDPEMNEENEEERVKKLVDEKEESTGHSKERNFVDDDEDGDEEREDRKDHNEKEEIINKDKYHHDDSQEAKHDVLDKKAQPATKSVEDFSKENDEDLRNLEEIKRHFGSKSSKEELFHPEKHNLAHSHEVSEESTERIQEEKRGYKPIHNDFEQRLHDYEEKRSHQEQGNHIAFGRGQKMHFDQDSLENSLQKNKYDKRTHSEKESSEESREKRHHHRDSEEMRGHHDSREESSEKEPKGHHYEEKRYHEERKRWPSQQNARLNYEESNEESKESEEDVDKFRERDRLEKEKFFRNLRHHLQDSEEDESYKPERKPEGTRHYIGEEMVDEMKRYYPEFSHEKDLRHYNEENAEELNSLNNEINKRHHSEDEIRLFNKYGLSDDPQRWKSRYFETDNSKEERKRNLQNPKMFPDYGDYDLWEKRQLLEDMNHEYGEKKSPFKFHKFEEKRQHDKMDELAQLLNYKKKSVEFPDFYDADEIKKRHYNERERLSQRPLTEEEEKELKNLAIMDIELQKIAEKLSNNRQG